MLPSGCDFWDAGIRGPDFARVAQALIELAHRGSEERAILESIQNHLRTHGGTRTPRQMNLYLDAAP